MTPGMRHTLDATLVGGDDLDDLVFTFDGDDEVEIDLPAQPGNVEHFESCMTGHLVPAPAPSDPSAAMPTALDDLTNRLIDALLGDVR